MRLRGAERGIFHLGVPSFEVLKRFDLLIELHDFVHRDTSAYLSQLFAESHHLTFIPSLPDARKARELNLPGDPAFDDKLALVKEGRSCPMEWLWAESKLHP